LHQKSSVARFGVVWYQTLQKYKKIKNCMKGEFYIANEYYYFKCKEEKKKYFNRLVTFSLETILTKRTLMCKEMCKVQNAKEIYAFYYSVLLFITQLIIIIIFIA
jgi:hypothetical protein